MLKSGFRTYPYNTQFGCTSNYFALVSAHSGDFLKVSVGWDVAGRNTSIQVVYESYFRWEAVGQRGESQETQEIQGRVSWSENLCLTCDFFVSFRTSEEQGVTSFVWQIKSYTMGKLSKYLTTILLSICVIITPMTWAGTWTFSPFLLKSISCHSFPTTVLFLETGNN